MTLTDLIIGQVCLSLSLFPSQTLTLSNRHELIFAFRKSSEPVRVIVEEDLGGCRYEKIVSCLSIRDLLDADGAELILDCVVRLLHDPYSILSFLLPLYRFLPSSTDLSVCLCIARRMLKIFGFC